jgi:peptidoglycan/xylan/chitin deacetylase (PgdA/CDA1 family)
MWRFPWGSANSYISWFKKDIIQRLYQEELEYADWNVSGEDSVGNPSVESILNNIKKDCFTVKDPVILLHDSNCNQATLNSLEQVISLLQEKGYTFETISERKEKCHFGEYSSS